MDARRGPATDAPRNAGRFDPWVLLPVGLALLVMLPLLTERSLWFDELLTVWAARLSVPDLVDLLRERGANLAAYYGFMHVWTIFGTGEVWLRLSSVLMAVGTVAALWGLARRLFDRRTAVIAATILAVHPTFVSLSRETRYYALLALGGTLSTWLFVRVVERPSPLRWATYVIATAATVYVHAFGALVILVHVASLLFVPPGRFRFRALVGWAVFGAFLTAPLAVITARQASDLTAWIPSLSGTWLLGFFLALGGGRPIQAVVVLAILIASCAAFVWRAQNARGEADARWSRWLAVLWLAVPLGVVLLVSIFRPLLLARYMVGTYPALALLAGAGLARLPRWAGTAGVALVGVLSAITVAGTYDAPPIEDWRGAAAFLSERMQADESVYVSGTWGIPPDVALPTISLGYYASRAEPSFDDRVLQVETLLRGLGSAERRPRVWVVVSSQSEFSPRLPRIDARLRAAGYASEIAQAFPGREPITVASYVHSGAPPS